MSEYTMQDMTFTLFKNEKKEAGSNQPDYTGKVMINGVEMRTAAWIKSKDGKAFFTGKISEARTKQESGPVEDPINPPTAGAGTDEMPF